MLKTATDLRYTAMTALVSCAALFVLLAFSWIIFEIVYNGLFQLSLDFIFSMPAKSGRQGGISSIIVSTTLILFICMSVCLPIGIGAAIFICEYCRDANRWAHFFKRILDVLAAVPSIVFGLFGNAFFCITLGMGYSLLAGGLTLACMVLPLMIRISEQSFSSVPSEYRRGAHALGISKSSSILKVLFPVALPGIIVGFVLSTGRAIAETAALLFTSGYVDRMPESLLDSGRTLSIHIYDLAMNVPGGNKNAYTTSLVLIFLVLLINLISSFVMRRYMSNLERSC